MNPEYLKYVPVRRISHYSSGLACMISLLRTSSKSALTQQHLLERHESLLLKDIDSLNSFGHTSHASLSAIALAHGFIHADEVTETVSALYDNPLDISGGGLWLGLSEFLANYAQGHKRAVFVAQPEVVQEDHDGNYNDGPPDVISEDRNGPLEWIRVTDVGTYSGVVRATVMNPESGTLERVDVTNITIRHLIALTPITLEWEFPVQR